MNGLQRIVLTEIANRTVIQGSHRKKIIDFLVVLINAARDQFTEDNKPTLDGFLTECFQEALEQTEQTEQNKNKKV